MHLSPREIELMLHQAGFLAQKRYARGLPLNYPEAVALIATQVLEWIREGAGVAELMDRGKQVLGVADVMPGVAEMIHEVQVEGTFPDGTKLVTVHQPVCREQGCPELALFGSGLTRKASPPVADNRVSDAPGRVTTRDGEHLLNEGREGVEIRVTNQGDRPVQVGSHYPFFETNAALSFDRSLAYGRRLNIAAGTAVRFEPGETKTVELVEVAGDRLIRGGNALTDGEASEANRAAALARAAAGGFAGAGEDAP